MANRADATELMQTAWDMRRRFLSASGNEQTALIAEARRQLEEAVAICRKTGELPELAQAIHLLANVENDMDRLDAAQELWEESVSICRAVGDEPQLAHKVRHLGDLHRRRGRLDRAERCYEEALTLYGRHEAPPDLDFANAVSRMASLKERKGATEEAIALWRQAGALYAAAGLPDGAEDCSRKAARLQSR